MKEAWKQKIEMEEKERKKRIARIYEIKGLSERPDLEAFIENSSIGRNAHDAYHPDEIQPKNKRAYIIGKDSVTIFPGRLPCGAASGVGYLLICDGIFAGISRACAPDSEKLDYLKRITGYNQWMKNRDKESTTLNDWNERRFNDKLEHNYIKYYFEGLEYKGPKVEIKTIIPEK